MLWIFLIIGVLGTIVLRSVSIESLIPINPRHSPKFLALFIVLGIVGALGLTGIYFWTYNEIIQTNSYNLISLTSSTFNIEINSKNTVYLVLDYEDGEPVYLFKCTDCRSGKTINKQIQVQNSCKYVENISRPFVTELTTFTVSKMNPYLHMFLAFGFGEKEKKTYHIHVPPKSLFEKLNS